MRLATIDVGTNTALLLIADVSGRNLSPLVEEERFVRLGEGVDRTGRIHPAAMQRLKTVLVEYRDLAAQWDAADVVVAGTSASRDAENKAELVAFVKRETALEYEILSGHDEALWSFAGAVSAFSDLAGPCTAVDIGGGSTEITVGEVGRAPWDATVRYRHSFNGGAVRLTERLFSRQPAPPVEVVQADELVRSMIAEAAVPPVSERPFIGVAGTVASLAFIEYGVASWGQIDRVVTLSAERVRFWRNRLLTMSYEDVLALNPVVMRGRADVFAAGVLILDVLMHQLGVSVCRVSPRDLRHGLALRYLQARDC